MNILYVTTIGITMGFFKAFIRELLDANHTVSIATNDTLGEVPACYREWGCKVYSLSCSRSPLDKGNAAAVGQIRKIVSKNRFDIVHCHTPIAAACARLACAGLRKSGTKVIYTAHGFHFYKGAPLKNWLLYYPVEKLCAYFTDGLITINKEDYELARKKLRAGKVFYFPGVGIDVSKFVNAKVDRQQKREEIGVPPDAFLLVSVGELSDRKNQETAIRSLAWLRNENVHYVIVGRGSNEQCLRSVAKDLGIEMQVHMLGFRNDIAELYKCADVCIFPSLQEGLPVAMMEAMASGLPVVASKIRGCVDLVDEEGAIYLCDPRDTEEFAQAIGVLMNDHLRRDKISQNNIQQSWHYDVKIINDRMRQIYQEVFQNGWSR